MSVVRANGGVCLRVDDDGPGIPVDDRTRVFERFTRLDPARVHGEPGAAGLGLALVRAVVERHHGSVAVHDAPTGGARLEVTLPASG
jgi:signal transduction histidine kinase